MDQPPRPSTARTSARTARRRSGQGDSIVASSTSRASLDAGLRYLPAALIALVLAVTILRLPIDLASIEPFDAYLVRAAGVATITIALVGVIAAAFVPMAYCKYGCPTGMLLYFVRSHGRADRFARRDWAAGAMVCLAFALYAAYPSVHHWIMR